jgi:hypothetical protein
MINGVIHDVGHAFVAFIKENSDGTSVRQVMGFYPTGSGIDAGVSSKGIIKDNSGSPYDVSYTISVTANQFNSALTKLSQDFTNKDYAVRTYNCTDAAISWMNAGGASFSNISRGWFVNTPGDFGEELRKNQNAVKTGGTAASGKGPCN